MQCGAVPPNLQRGLAAMQARGPDGEGQWQENEVALGHRRLAILDLAPRAAQPMHSADGRYVIVFNGEIYNFRTLREALISDGESFRTEGDTEVILALFAREGERMLPKLHGMFAFAIWDRQTRRMFAARDPYGIKPLYIARIPNGVLLASQVKALLATGEVDETPDPRGVAGFWMLGSVPEPYTWYRDIQPLPAGHCAWIEGGMITRTVCWHDIGAVWREAPRDAQPDAEVQDGVRAALRESVARHLVSDVPVGVFLSGGIDSGTLAGLMVEAGVSDLCGVTVAYDEYAGTIHDEAPVAAEIARYYGLRHHVRRVTRDEFLADLPRIFADMDQPTLDGINTWYVSKAVAELGLKVVVSGVGGDELFHGYELFYRLPRLWAFWRLLSSIPGVLPLARRVGAWRARRKGNLLWRYAADWLRSIEGAWWLSRSIFAPDNLPKPLVAAIAPNGFDPRTQVQSMVGRLPDDPWLALSQIESMTYLRNQLLRDSDWASMAHSVELRTPLVDASLLAQLQPWLAAFHRFPRKRLLAYAPEKPLPEAVIQRKKTGFVIPVMRWLAEAGIAPDGIKNWARYVANRWALPPEMSV
ncbi:asparagine synthase (glutamine-hydrolyzing) [Hydrogenophilus islandicus]